MQRYALHNVNYLMLRLYSSLKIIQLKMQEVLLIFILMLKLSAATMLQQNTSGHHPSLEKHLVPWSMISVANANGPKNQKTSLLMNCKY